MRLLSRIFGGFMLFAALVFGGVSPSFAATGLPDNKEDCEQMGYQWDDDNKVCCLYLFSNGKSRVCVTQENWEEYWDVLFGELGCDPAAGYIDPEKGPMCCPEGMGNPETHLCCDEPLVFDPETKTCVEQQTISCEPGWYYDDENCTICPAGYYCTGGSTPPVACPGGKYSTGGASTSSCTGNISAGYFSTGGGTSASPSGPNNGCLSGYKCGACAQGSYSGSDLSYCTACGNGTTTSSTGSTSSSACTACSNNNGHVATWVGQSWVQNSNTVSNLCVISTCASGYERTGSSPYQCTVANTNCYKFAVDNTTNGGNNNNGATTEFWMYLDTSTYNAQNCNIYPTTTDCANGTNVMSGIVLPNPPSGATYAGQYSTTGNNASSPYNEGWFNNSTGAQNIAPDYNHCSNLSNTQGYYNSLLSTFGFQASSTPSITLRALYSCGYGYSLVNGVCTANTITLDWDENDGSTISNGSCTYGGNLVLPSAPTRSGFDFLGWNTADGVTHAAGETITGGCDVTHVGVSEGTSTYIQAQWTSSCVLIRIAANANGGEVTAYTNLYKLRTQTGWFTDSGCTQSTNGPTSITAGKDNADFAGIYDCPGGLSCAGSGTQLIGADGTLNAVITEGGWVYPQYNCRSGWQGSGVNISGVCTQGGTITCAAGTYLPAGATTCTTCTANYYCPGWTGTYDGNEHGQNSCGDNTGGIYTKSSTGRTNVNQCYVQCTKGTRVREQYGACVSDANPWFITSNHNVSYGRVSPVSFCMYDSAQSWGYKAAGTTAAGHDAQADCVIGVAAGYEVANTYLDHVDAISIENASTTQDLGLVEIQALDANGNVANLVYDSANSVGVTNPANSTNGNFDNGTYAVIKKKTNNVSGVAIWNYGGNLSKINIGLVTGYLYDKISVKILRQGVWYTVVNNESFYHTSSILTNGGQSIYFSGLPTACAAGKYQNNANSLGLGSTRTCESVPAGYWNDGCGTNATGGVCSGHNGGLISAGYYGTAGATSSTGSGLVNAGYYSTGGGTSATPTAAGNGCLSGKTCGKCPTGWPHSAAGSNEITDCYSDTKSRAWSGTQTACANPDTTGCSAVTCASCSNSACNYVAYVNAAGNADGEIKSGCETNNASCQQTVASLTPNTGYHTTSGNLEYCPANTYTVTFNANGGTGSPSTSEITCVYDDTCPAFATQGTLSKANATFGGWNTASDGTGTSYAEGATPTNLTSTNDATVPLYAVWITSGCPGGQYLNNGSCISCPAGYSCAGEEAQPVMCATNTYSTDGAASCTACTGGLTTSSVADSRYHDEVGDCGRILHIDTYEIRLKSVPSGTTIPSPAVRFDYDGDGTADFYARMSLVESPMRVTSSGQISSGTNEKSFKTRYNNSVYCVCDDGTCQ